MNRQRRGWYEQKQYIRHLHKKVAYKHHRAAIKNKRTRKPDFRALEIYRPQKKQLVNWNEDTGVCKYDECIHDSNGDYEIKKVYMTPIQYINFQKKMIAKRTSKSPDHIFWSGINRADIASAKKDILDGRKIPTFAIEFDEKGRYIGENTRNRLAIALKELNIDTIPIYIMKKK